MENLKKLKDKKIKIFRIRGVLRIFRNFNIIHIVYTLRMWGPFIQNMSKLAEIQGAGRSLVNYGTYSISLKSNYVGTHSNNMCGGRLHGACIEYKQLPIFYTIYVLRSRYNFLVSRTPGIQFKIFWEKSSDFEISLWHL